MSTRMGIRSGDPAERSGSHPAGNEAPSRVVTFERVRMGGWPDCARIANGTIDLVVTLDVGPRVIRAGFVGGQNVFKVFPDTLGRVGGDEWHSYGGHRLWHAPEVYPRTYAPDNEPVSYSWDGRCLTARSLEPVNGLSKALEITVADDRPVVDVIHRLTNDNPWAIELAPWALSVMAPGGRAIYPQEEYRPHPDVLAPARPMVLWHFTDMSDGRWTWGRRYIQLRQDPAATTKQKVGFFNRQGWAAYVLGQDVFIKLYDAIPSAVYPDMGCNTETYTDPEMLEIETLGPLTRLEPGASVDHRESWMLARVECGFADEEIDARILPLVASFKAGR